MRARRSKGANQREPHEAGEGGPRPNDLFLFPPALLTRKENVREPNNPGLALLFFYAIFGGALRNTLLSNF